MSTALKNRYLWFLHLHHHPAALDHVCTLGIARHITALNAPLRWRSRVLNIEKMLELIRKAGGPSRVPSWRYLAERLGFDCQVATSMACRLKKFVYGDAEHHFDVFLETTLDTDTDWSRVYCGTARGSCDDDKATEHVRPSCKVSVTANDGDDKVAAGVQETLKEATQGSGHVPIRSPTMTTANATTTADITTSADITNTSTSTNMDQNNACADEHDNSASADPVYEPQANPYHQPGTPPPIFHPSIAVALPFAYHSQATTHPAMPPISPGTWSQLHALWWPHLHHPHHPHPYYTADQFSALASQHQILDRNGGRVCATGGWRAPHRRCRLCRDDGRAHAM
ncbi:hypothetical protein BC831DRAFT_270589 [Entophlyctis helioformis]|nr:hypothetical protein BC831DRAFT_270589 [Entophlyctis helioformis]